jgi:hypothetical protein
MSSWRIFLGEMVVEECRRIGASVEECGRMGVSVEVGVGVGRRTGVGRHHYYVIYLHHRGTYWDLDVREVTRWDDEQVIRLHRLHLSDSELSEVFENRYALSSFLQRNDTRRLD